MNKIIRTLVFNGEVSLIAVDSTQMINDAIDIHHLSPVGAVVFGKAITAMTYMASWLKDSTGEVSANIKGNGFGGAICISGDSSLNMRGTIENPQTHCSESDVIGHEGYMTVVRDDGYSQPFVGTVPISSGVVERLFMDYYATSEQLPTFIKEEVLIGEDKRCASSVGIFLQPMPSASVAAKAKALAALRDFSPAAAFVKEKGLEAYIKEHFDTNETEEDNAEYRCHCSRGYIEGLLLSMNRDELDNIIRQDGKVNVHCHYCHTDYDFDKEDVDKLFEKKA